MKNLADHGRPESIERIKKALADGTYHVSSAEVVRAIIDQKRYLDATEEVDKD